MRKLLYLSGILLFLSSCSWLNPSIMLKTGKDYQFSKNPDSARIVDYKISPNDILQFNMYSNDGFKLIDITSLNSANAAYHINVELPYQVESDGNVKLPILGRKNLAGLTIREAESVLEESYSSFYVRPFIEINITNKRVIVFPGSNGDARVIPLANNNTTLLEAIALAGGIAENGKAKMVKLMRNVDNKQYVFKMDLSTIEGLKDGNTVLQANDIIYIEPVRKYSEKLLQNLAPILSLIATTFLLFTYSKALAK